MARQLADQLGLDRHRARIADSCSHSVDHAFAAEQAIQEIRAASDGRAKFRRFGQNRPRRTRRDGDDILDGKPRGIEANRALRLAVIRNHRSHPLSVNARIDRS